MQAITQKEFKQISQLLHDQCGINLNDDQDYLVETRLSHFAKSLGLKNFGELTERLRTSPGKLLPTVINLMTTNETLWFRDESCWNALEKTILPRLLKTLENNLCDDIRVWIAGCSTGQEAYSLAILIDEISSKINKPFLSRRFHIEAMDISETALDAARAARYNDFEIKRGLSLERRNKYFDYVDSYWILRPNIRLRVQFDSVNLTHNFSGLGRFDLILCRNVTIYFTPQMRHKILSTMVKMLNPQGVLLIGATESISKYKNEFNTVEFEGCIYIKA